MTHYEIRYGKHPDKVGQPFSVKTIITTDFNQACRMYDKVKSFAEKHGVTWTISLWERYENVAPRAWLIQSCTTNL